jgi:hypothetical protein
MCALIVIPPGGHEMATLDSCTVGTRSRHWVAIDTTPQSVTKSWFRTHRLLGRSGGAVISPVLSAFRYDAQQRYRAHCLRGDLHSDKTRQLTGCLECKGSANRDLKMFLTQMRVFLRAQVCYGTPPRPPSCECRAPTKEKMTTEANSFTVSSLLNCTVSGSFMGLYIQNHMSALLLCPF